MTDNPILRVSVKMLFPMILLFAFYVQFHGDYGPGGGFQAGVIFAAGVIVHALVFGLAPAQKVFSLTLVEILIPLGLLLYAGVGVVCLLMGGQFLEYTALTGNMGSGNHLGILLIEAGVGITVAAVMIRIFYAIASRRLAR